MKLERMTRCADIAKVVAFLKPLNNGSLRGIEVIENPVFNLFITRQGNRVLVTRRRGALVIRECLVEGLTTQKRKP